jgi:hypothetical protein
MRPSGLVTRNKQCTASFCRVEYWCVLKLVAVLFTKMITPVSQTRLHHIPEGNDSSLLRHSSLTVVECSQGKDNITGATGQGEGRGARKEEEKDKQFGKWCQHKEL